MNDMNRRQTIDEIVGNNVKTFRKIHNLKRKELADKFHISDDAMYRIERGETGLSGEYAYILANEYNCDMNFIYGKMSPAEYAAKAAESQIVQIESAASESNSKNIMKLVSRVLNFAVEVLDAEKENN